MWFNSIILEIWQKLPSELFLVPEKMSPLYVQSKVCMAPFHVRSKVCIVPIHVRSKVCKFAPHMDGRNADFAPHMEGSHANFAPYMERRYSFMDQIIAKTAIFANFERKLVKTTNSVGVYMNYVCAFENFFFFLIECL